MDVSGCRRVLVACATGTVAALCASGVACTAAWASPTVTTIATGLDNPRGLAFGPDGRLYVGESGHGGPECNQAEGLCFGFTSGISAIDASGVHRVVSGLISRAAKSGFFAEGIEGISVHGNGGLFAIMSGNSDRAPNLANTENEAMAREQLGRLIKANPSGKWKAVADVGHFDFQWSAEHFKEVLPGPNFPPEANPYGVLAEPGKRWVVDAASNTLDEVRADGSVRVVAFIPNPEVFDAVPTCVDRGPDDAFYVGEFTGRGNGPDAVVWRIVPGEQPEAWATGLSLVSACGFGSDGQFYATEFSTKGWASFEGGVLVRVPAHSTQPITFVSGLKFPGGFAAGPDGAIYVSNWSTAPANSGGGPTGQVVRITP